MHLKVAFCGGDKPLCYSKPHVSTKCRLKEIILFKGSNYVIL